MVHRRRVLSAFAVLFLGLLTIALRLGAQAVEVTRGPYLQLGTPTSVVVRWRTGTPTDTEVRYGTEPRALTEIVSHAAQATEHVVTLPGLSPHTRYFYSVGTSTATLAGGDAEHTFVTAPAPGSRTPTRIWVLGDSGTADHRARAVRDGFTVRTRSRGTDLWLMLGDNAYPVGSDAQYQSAVFDTYAATLRQAVLWPTLGNHDALSADSPTQSGVYYDVFTLPTGGEAGGVPSGTEAYYAFDYGNIHFVCLDSSDSDRSPTGAMVTWLARDLAATRADWIVAFFHHAAYSKGSHDSDVEAPLVDMRQNVVPVLEAAGVDLVLAGHSHSYERSYLLNGHTGPSSSFGPQHQVDGGRGDERVTGPYRKPVGVAPGAVYVVAGSSGQTSIGPLDHPAMVESRVALGSVLVDVDGPRMDVTFLGAEGEELDRFTLSKHVDAAPPAAPRDLQARVTLGGGPQVVLDWMSGIGGGAPDSFVLEAGTRRGATDLGWLSTGERRTEFRSALGPGRFFVRARAQNAFGTSAVSEDAEIVVDRLGGWVPAAPTNLIARIAGTSVSLEWTASPNASTHHLEVGSAPQLADLASLPVAGTAVSASGVPPGVYFVRVRGLGPTGLPGPATEDQQVAVGGALAAPDRPSALRPSVRDRRVSLVWRPSDREPAAHRWVVEATPDGAPRATAHFVTTGAATAFAVADVPPGTYFVRVRGENARGLGLPSAPVRVDVP